MKFKEWGLGLALVTLSAGSVLATVPDDQSKLEARLEQLQEALDAAKDARYEAYSKATNGTEQQAALARKPWADLDETARQLADDAEGTEVAAEVWSLLFLNTDRANKEDMFEAYWILIEDYTESPALIPVVENVQYIERGQDQAKDGLRQLIELSETKRTIAASMLSLGKMLEQKEHTRAEAFDLFRTVSKKYPEAMNSKGRKYSDLAEATLFEAERLQVGMVVPNIGSIDETGTKFELDDYKGKVVLLDFWAFW
jgi:hypothetical protein